MDGDALPDLTHVVTPPLLELSGITKAFGGVAALRDVEFSLLRGEIHGLVGENGAGKSTLMKIIAGVHVDYQGEMRLDGRTVRYASPRDARGSGIGMVHQELSAVRDLSVAENVHLGIQPLNRFGLIDWRAMRRSASEHLQSLGIDVDPRTPMGALPLGYSNSWNSARVLFSGARIHHSGRTDVGAIAAGGGPPVRPVAPPPRGRPQHRVHLPLPR